MSLNTQRHRNRADRRRADAGDDTSDADDLAQRVRKLEDRADDLERRVDNLEKTSPDGDGDGDGPEARRASASRRGPQSRAEMARALATNPARYATADAAARAVLRAGRRAGYTK